MKNSAKALLLYLALWIPALYAQNISPVAAAEEPLINIDANVLITMRDGIEISVDIYRPAGNGAYPTLYAAAPYPHNSDLTVPNNSLTGPIAWYVSQGYSYVLASTRGSGLSGGSYELLSREEQQDHYEIIEWIAQQEWSNGKVAGIGAGYYASTQWQMAIQNPPHLECIAPYNGVVQPYQDWAYTGGIASTLFSQDWYSAQVRQKNAFPETGPTRIVDYDLDLQLLLHTDYDDYWRLRSSLENIDEISIPVFMLRSWDQSKPGLTGTFSTLEELNSVHKLLVLGYDQGINAYQDPNFLEQEVLPFYTWCLNDRQTTSFIEQPRIRYYVRGQNQLKRENSWPPGNTAATAFFLNQQAQTQSETAGLNLTPQGSNLSVSQYATDSENSSSTFISEVLEQDIEITGSLMMELYASSSARDTAFEITLSEEHIFSQAAHNQTLPSFFLPDARSMDDSLNTTTLVSTGILKASSQGGVLSPGVIRRFDVALQPTSYRFKRGNRIILEISKAKDSSLANSSSQDAIFHSTRYPSRLWLPMVQAIRNTF